MTHRTVNVRCKGRPYTIEIAPKILQKAGEYIKPLTELPYVVIIADSTVASHHLSVLRKSLSRVHLEARVYVVESGESSKSIETYARLTEAILTDGVERKSLLIALGGGVVGDLAGFIAASVLRGLAFVQIPTTLLAQVDSSVGGKTGINARVGKNLIGAFHQPKLVISDINVLKTLPKREILAGYAEVVKYGLIKEYAFFSWLEKNGNLVIEGREDALIYAIEMSCKIKAGIVERDERESGERALLNLGHTFGHAIEAVAGFDGTILHGEAVSIGLVLAYKTAFKLQLVEQEDVERVAKHLKSVGLPISLKEVRGAFDVNGLLHYMRKDKKVSCGAVRFVMPRSIGKCLVKDDIDEELIRSIWRENL